MFDLNFGSKNARKILSESFSIKTIVGDRKKTYIFWNSLETMISEIATMDNGIRTFREIKKINPFFENVTEILKELNKEYELKMKTYAEHHQKMTERQIGFVLRDYYEKLENRIYEKHIESAIAFLENKILITAYDGNYGRGEFKKSVEENFKKFEKKFDEFDILG